MTTYQPANAQPGKQARPRSSSRYCRASDLAKEKAGPTQHDIAAERDPADPTQPLMEDWVDSPSCFSVVRHSIKDMNEDIFKDIQQKLPSMEGDPNAEAGEDSDSDEEIVFYSQKCKTNRPAKAAAANSLAADLAKTDIGEGAASSKGRYGDDDSDEEDEILYQEEKPKEDLASLANLPALKGQVPR